MFRDRPVPLLVFMALIVAGGLGFVVLAALGAAIVRRGRQRMTVQVRVVLVATAVLLVGGALFYLLVEWDRTLTGLTVGDKVVNALFQSATLRTAGFNSIDLAPLAPATLLVMLLLMFIGASPGSTGGGVKTTTVAVLLASVRASVTSRDAVVLFRRRVPPEIVLRSLAIVVISLAIVSLGTLVLVLAMDATIDGARFPTGSANEVPFEHLVFEAVSAFGTVGLSLGATTQLGPVGKLVITLCMFVGRIGPLTLALLIGARRDRVARMSRPVTRLMVG
jgi:trk system potassium uptake protein TrkH